MRIKAELESTLRCGELRAHMGKARGLRVESCMEKCRAAVLDGLTLAVGMSDPGGSDGIATLARQLQGDDRRFPLLNLTWEYDQADFLAAEFIRVDRAPEYSLDEFPNQAKAYRVDARCPGCGRCARTQIHDLKLTGALNGPWVVTNSGELLVEKRYVPIFEAAGCSGRRLANRADYVQIKPDGTFEVLPVPGRYLAGEICGECGLYDSFSFTDLRAGSTPISKSPKPVLFERRWPIAIRQPGPGAHLVSTQQDGPLGDETLAQTIPIHIFSRSLVKSLFQAGAPTEWLLPVQVVL